MFVELFVELLVELFVEPSVELFVELSVELFVELLVELFDASSDLSFVPPSFELLVEGASVPQVPETQYSPEKQSECSLQLLEESAQPANISAAVRKVSRFILFSCQNS